MISFKVQFVTVIILSEVNFKLHVFLRWSLRIKCNQINMKELDKNVQKFVPLFNVRASFSYNKVIINQIMRPRLNF